MMIIARIGIWLATSKVGQYIVAGFGIFAAIGLAVLKVFSAGKAAERAHEDQASLENLRSRSETNDEISTLAPSDVHDRMSRWVRKDDNG